MPPTPAASKWRTACPPDLTCPPASSRRTSGCSREQVINEPAPSLHPDYQSFIATTSRSASACRIGTQRLTVSAAQRAPSRQLASLRQSWAYQHSPSHVPCRSRRPDSRRLNAGHRLANRRDPARLIPAPFNRPGFDVSYLFRHFVSGSLSLAFPV